MAKMIIVNGQSFVADSTGNTWTRDIKQAHVFDDLDPNERVSDIVKMWQDGGHSHVHLKYISDF